MNVGDEVYFFIDMGEECERTGYAVGRAKITTKQGDSHDIDVVNIITTTEHEESDDVFFSMTTCNNLATTKEGLKILVQNHFDRIIKDLNNDIDGLT